MQNALRCSHHELQHMRPLALHQSKGGSSFPPSSLLFQGLKSQQLNEDRLRSKRWEMVRHLINEVEFQQRQLFRMDSDRKSHEHREAPGPIGFQLFSDHPLSPCGFRYSRLTCLCNGCNHARIPRLTFRKFCHNICLCRLI